MDEGLIKIIVALIGLLGAIITGVVVPYIRTKTTKEQRDNLYNIIKIAVQAADQLLKLTDPTGENRKQYVLNYLNNIGLKVNSEDLETMIESAVNELNLLQKKLTTN